jgi:thioredoxin reductase (NADPH)
MTVVGAGPAGLSAALISASVGLHTLLLEPRTVGGQASSTSMVRNYPGFVRGISGHKLTRTAARQAMLSAPNWSSVGPATPPAKPPSTSPSTPSR